MHHHVLTSRWRLDAPAERVWQLLTDIDGWPRWWRYVRQVRVVAAGGPDAVGQVVAIEWASALPYRIRLQVTTTRTERARQLEGRADGDLQGCGTWVLEPAAADTVDVTYRWDVTLHKPWMCVTAFLLRPLFEWNHFVVMRAGAQGMAQVLGCRVLRASEWAGAMR
jgi:uncharacterized protein YndB with AHSA1/START domain